MTKRVLEILDELNATPPGDSWRVMRSLAETPDVVAILRAIRRNGPGAYRARALNVLMYLGGPDALAPADLAAAVRLIGIRRRTDPIDSVCTSGWTTWWCVRCDDQAAVIAALALTDVTPTTYRLARSVISSLEDDSGVVYVGPSTNGWVPVAGPWCDVTDGTGQATVERLSARFGEAHAYSFNEQGDGSAWLVAQDGVTIRRLNTLDPAGSVGDPLPVERDWTMGRLPAANDVAAAISVDIGWLHPRDAIVLGAPVLARVPNTPAVELLPGHYEI